MGNGDTDGRESKMVVSLTGILPFCDLYEQELGPGNVGEGRSQGGLATTTLRREDGKGGEMAGSRWLVCAKGWAPSPTLFLWNMVWEGVGGLNKPGKRIGTMNS